jgi:hypothetical protein
VNRFKKNISFLNVTALIVGIGVAIFFTYWLITHPRESYSAPIIFVLLVNLMGWNGAAIVLGTLSGMLAGILVSFLDILKFKKDEANYAQASNQNPLWLYIKNRWFVWSVIGFFAIVLWDDINNGRLF